MPVCFSRIRDHLDFHHRTGSDSTVENRTCHTVTATLTGQEDEGTRAKLFPRKCFLALHTVDTLPVRVALEAFVTLWHGRRAGGKFHQALRQ